MTTISDKRLRRYKIALSSEYKMRRKTLRNTRFLQLIIFTLFLTFVIYKLMRTNVPRDVSEHFNRPNMQKLKAVYKVNNEKANVRIDWHNHTQIELEKERKGPGEQGAATDFSHIPKDLLDRLYKENGYNGALSDIISIHRALPDVRPANCSNILYKRHLPQASVIIPFHNEHFSVVVRTVQSVIRRSPEHLIKDIILVDDCSTKEFLKQELEDYLSENIPKAKILRFKQRKGLIVARQEGAKLAHGEVLLFLDAHCEANVNWLPPLLDLVSDNYRTCVCPFVDMIDFDTYKYDADSGWRGAFDWNLNYQRLNKFKRYDDLPTKPFESPVMLGGLFAISAKFFWELGGYDEGLFIWGGEQFELSFKIWQCGGKLLDVPCSRVGHLYRKFDAFTNPDNNSDFLCKNFMRVAEVWMDEYKEYFFTRQTNCANMTCGDISKQLAIRKKLNCKSFKWYMEEVAYDVTNRYPLIEPPDIAFGKIQNIENPDYCIETTDKEIKLTKCSKPSYSLEIQFTWRGEIKDKYSENCWDVSNYKKNKLKVSLLECHFVAGNQLWSYDEDYSTIKHEGSGMCLDMSIDPAIEMFVTECEPELKSQMWKLTNFNRDQQDKVPEFLKYMIIDGK